MNIRNLIVAGIIMTVSSATLSADEPVALCKSLHRNNELRNDESGCNLS